MTYRKDFDHGGERLRVTMRHLEGDRYEVMVGDRRHEVRARAQSNGRVAMSLDGTKVVAASAQSGDRVQVRLAGHTWTLEPDRGRTGGATSGGSGEIIAPMTGTLSSLAVEVGQDVAEGDTVALLSAMKMEHRLKADVAGRVVELGAQEGANVDQGAMLVRIEPASGEV